MSSTKSAKIAIVMGSDSDWPIMKSCHQMLEQFGINADVRILSAHRCAEKTAKFAAEAAENGIEVIIAAAGMAAHLAGVIAAHTTLPVIGVPMASGSLQGIDALLSTVQMPPGIPVATVGIGAAGAKNAAILAVQILAKQNGQLIEKLVDYKGQLAKAVAEKDAALKKELAGK